MNSRTLSVTSMDKLGGYLIGKYEELAKIETLTSSQGDAEASVERYFCPDLADLIAEVKEGRRLARYYPDQEYCGENWRDLLIRCLEILTRQKILQGSRAGNNILDYCQLDYEEYINQVMNARLQDKPDILRGGCTSLMDTMPCRDQLIHSINVSFTGERLLKYREGLGCHQINEKIDWDNNVPWIGKAQRVAPTRIILDAWRITGFLYGLRHTLERPVKEVIEEQISRQLRLQLRQLLNDEDLQELAAFKLASDAIEVYRHFLADAEAEKDLNSAREYMRDIWNQDPLGAFLTLVILLVQSTARLCWSLEDTDLPWEGLYIGVGNIRCFVPAHMLEIQMTPRESRAVFLPSPPHELDPATPWRKFLQEPLTPSQIQWVGLALGSDGMGLIADSQAETFLSGWAAPGYKPQRVWHGPNVPPTRLTWLHISDLHSGKESAFEGYDLGLIAEKLVSKVEKEVEERDLPIDFIVFTGDLAHKGKFEQCEQAWEVLLAELVDKTGVPQERLFLVPGNHDVDWALITEDDISEYGERPSSREQVIEMLCSEEQTDRLLAKFDGYGKFVRERFGHNFDKDSYYYVRNFEAAGKKVAILGLNSVLRSGYCKDDEGEVGDKGKLFLGELQVKAAVKSEEARSANLRIALMHHPFEMLQPFDRETTEVYLSECHFILHGHIHEPEMIQTLRPGRTMPNQVFGAGACYQREEPDEETYPNGFNIVSLDFRSRKGTIFLYAYSPRRGGFWAPDTLSYPEVEGRWTFDLPRDLIG